MAVSFFKIAVCKDNISATVAEIKAKLKGLGAASRDAILSAAVETLENIVSYSGAGQINIELNRTSRKIILTITDSGVPFDPRSLKEDANKGLGLLIACNMADDYSYRYEDGKNISVFEKYL